MTQRKSHAERNDTLIWRPAATTSLQGSKTAWKCLHTVMHVKIFI